jgi:hypothetical protein
LRQGASQGYIRERWPVLISSSPFPKVCTLSNIHCTTPLASRSARLAESPPRFSTWKTWGQSLSKYPRGRAGSCATSVSRNNSYTQEASHRRSSPAFFYCFLIILLLTITLRSHLHTSFLDTCTASHCLSQTCCSTCLPVFFLYVAAVVGVFQCEDFFFSRRPSHTFTTPTSAPCARSLTIHPVLAKPCSEYVL